MTIPAWFIPSMIALVFSGVTTFLPKIALRTMGPLTLVVYHAGFSIVCALAVQFFYGGITFDARGAAWAMAAGAAGSLGQLLYLAALWRGPLTYVSMISSLYPLVTTLLACAILHEPLTLRQMAGVVLGISAIALLVASRDR